MERKNKKLIASFLCAVFGHRTSGDEFDGGEYMKVERRAIDGIGRHHAQITTDCKRCGEKFRVGMVHLPPNGCS